MKVTYYGHACFMVSAAGKRLLFDPYITRNELAGHIDINTIHADYIFVSHGHFDHMLDVVAIARRTGATVLAGWELFNYFGKEGLTNVIPINPGGKYTFDFGTVKAFAAEHSSSLEDGTYAGMAAGFAFKTVDGNFYYSGDTALTLDMKLVAKWVSVDFAVFPIGGGLTMDGEDAIEAAGLVKTRQVIGVHYDTFPFIRIDKLSTMAAFERSGLRLHLPEPGSTIVIKK